MSAYELSQMFKRVVGPIMSAALEMDKVQRAVVLGVLMTAIAVQEGVPSLRATIDAGMATVERRVQP